MKGLVNIQINNQTRTSITWSLRLILGTIFIFSGLVKGIDPWGTLYKVEAYLHVMNLEVWDNLVLTGVFCLSALEFCLGIFLMLGLFRRGSVIVALVFMAIMTPLTLWLALTDSVEDCGCFGEAIHISNWTTFWKNVFLTLALLWLLKNNRRVHWGVTPALQWMALLFSATYLLIIEFVGYMEQPLIDFRAYKVGETIISDDTQQEKVPEYTFIYEKDGVEKEFHETDSLPDENDGWSFIDRKEIRSATTNIAPQNKDKTFRIWNKNSGEDITEEVVPEDGKEMIIMIPDLKEVSPATTWKLNALYEWALTNEILFYAVVSGNNNDIDRWVDLSMASYDIHTADDTQIKEVVRGNPGIVFIEDGVIKWKTSLRSIEIEEFTQGDISAPDVKFSLHNKTYLINLTLLYISLIALLISCSFIPIIKRLYFGKRSSSIM